MGQGEVIHTLLSSSKPSEALALALLRMLADAGVSRDPDTWVLLGDAGLKAIFGPAAWVAFQTRAPGVLEKMRRLAPLIEDWP